MIQQLLKTISDQMTIEGSSPAKVPTFLHGWKGLNNLVADEIENTLITLIDPVQSNSTLRGNVMKDSYTLLMAFLEKSELDWSPDQHLVVIDRMRRLCAKFVYACKQSDLFSDVGDPIISDEYNVFDCGLSGVGLQIKITPQIPTPVC